MARDSTMLRTYLIRSDLRPVFSSVSSGTAVWTNTKEATPTEILVPTPTLTFGVKSTGVVASARSITAPAAVTAPSEPAASEAASEAEAAERPDAQTMLGVPVHRVREVTEESGSPPVMEPAAQPPVWAQLIEQPPDDAAAPKIHLNIDALPHLELIEAFPVTVKQLGDNLFTATVHALRLTGTSTTSTEALVTVKEEIETMYERLTRSTRLDADEKRDLQYLQSRIKSSVQARVHKSGLFR